jgi:glyoxylase-like metal-dependent hydrolase (beta-lactamase superfamily II)
VGGVRYLFTGDTIFPAGDGTWSTFVIPGRGDAAAMRDSLKLLGTLEPDLVISSAFAGETAIEAVDAERWSVVVDQALASVKS